MSQLLLPAAVRSLQWQRRRLLLSQYAEFNFVPGFPQTIYQEFYCDASGAGSASNLNGGSDTSAPIVDLAGTYNRGLGFGGTDQILASSGTPFANVVPGSYVGIKAAAGTGVLDYCAAVLAVNGGGTDIFVADGTVSTRSFGTRPADAASIDSRVGGRWLGPNAAVGFPFGSITGTARDANGNEPWVNFINTASYSITAAITHSLAGVSFGGMTVTPRDLGKAVIDGGTAGVSYTLLTLSGTGSILQDFTFQNNGASSNILAVTVTGANCFTNRVIVHDVRGVGLNLSGSMNYGLECEVYNWNQNNTAGSAGMQVSGQAMASFCNVHNGTGAQSAGFSTASGGASGPALFNCLAHSVGTTSVGNTSIAWTPSVSHGFVLGNTSTSGALLVGCEAYNNGASGAFINHGNANYGMFVIRNCNFIANGDWGIDASLVTTGTNRINGLIQNCGFGSKGYSNPRGPIRFGDKGTLQQSDNFIYAPPGHPYANPATGDFRLVHRQALGAGRGSFTQTGNSKSGSVAYPDVGSCQSRRPPRRVFPGGVGA